MRLLAIEKIAKNKGILNTWKFTKRELIQAIQKAEGYNDCFAASSKNCLETNCCWRADCLK